MRKHYLRRVVAILSISSVVGGIAAMSYSYLSIREAEISSSHDYLPAMQKNWVSETRTSEVKSIALRKGTYIGLLQIASVKLKVNIFEGTEKSSLSRGAGHYLQSVMPGESDNTVIAGHRDTVFAPLARIKIGAPIVITTRDGVFTYRVTATRIVGKNDRSVIVPSDSATVTLSTCYPFRFIGSAPERFIVSGRLTSSIPQKIAVLSQ
jgi:LPXTG-site transpeptidase (sortase) family protein